MIRSFWFLVHGCWHVWTPTGQATYRHTWRGKDVETGPCVYVVCKKCGHRKLIEDATIGENENGRAL